jgi:hypothetical protein
MIAIDSSSWIAFFSENEPAACAPGSSLAGGAGAWLTR